MQVEAWLQRAAASAPTVTALQTPDGACSYAQLESAARAGASQLTERGVRPGGRVAIALPPGIAFAQAMHACFLLGAVAVPIDIRLSSAERERLIAGATLVGEPLRDESAAGEGVLADEGALDAVHDLDAVAAVIHTSGTTSAPRPIELTYGNFLWSALGSGVALGVDPRERWLCALPSSHVGGLSILVRSAIYATTAVIHERFDTERALAALRDEQITLVSLVSTTLARLLDAGLRDPPALRCALTGGGPVPASLIERARNAGVPVSLTYGLTEACSQVTTGGPPLFCTRVCVAGAPPAEPGVGEIMVAGATVAPASRGPGGWLRTGDLGALDEHGFLRVTGRKADTIVTGGENVAPAEVEAVLESHPGVIEAAVLGREDPHWGEAVTAIVVAAPGASLDEAALREHCTAALASYKVPKRFALVADPLPRTPSGKLLRRELR
jgi:O-succinylbenzoic acid--CoA ligase